ncbi:MAG: prepilin-type N-terminal cleavage/methylation domain-containing protein [Deltaproteobacteria bacterium]|nr:prepilin-type N-terminal cleavage/methylation domain-containing protein [Deltaproteobacteria bacterium]
MGGSRKSTTARGFTVIEVLVAVAILSLMLIIGWGTTSETIKARKHYEKIQDRYREVRVAMSRLARDLSMAFLSQNEDRNQLEPRTFFVGESSGDADSARFTTLSHTPLFADANESDQAVVSYYVASSRDDRSISHLYRRESRRLANEKPDTLPGEAEVIFTGVVKFKLSYWNAQDREWEDTWSTQSTGGSLPKPPDRVKISLTFLDERGKEVTFITETRVYMQELLSFHVG